MATGQKETIMDKKKKSWKTTTVGILTGLGILAAQASNLLDEDPATVLSVEAVMTALAAFGIGFFSRDHGVSSAAAKVDG